MSNNTEPKFFTPPQALEAVAGARPLDAIFKNPPMGVDGTVPAEKKTGKKVGIVCNKKGVLAWSYAEDLDIRVTGHVTGPGEMNVFAYKNNMCVLQGTVFGSRWEACRIICYIRNGLVSGCMKRRRNKANRAARKAAALNPVNPVNPV